MKEWITKENRIRLLPNCEKEKHIQRDNSFGVTWCIVCGRLFNKSCGKRLGE